MSDQYSLMSPVLPSEEEARTHLGTLRDGMQSYLAHERLCTVGHPELPTAGCEAWVEDGMRCVLAYQLFFCVGMDDDGEPIYESGWISRVDVFAEKCADA